MTGRVFRRRIFQARNLWQSDPQYGWCARFKSPCWSASRCTRWRERGSPENSLTNALFHALSFISISIVGATVVIRRTLILPSEGLLKERSADSVAVARWRTGYLFLYALCELLGMFGLILRMSGFTLGNVWGFYLGGFVLLLLYSPRPPRAEFG